NYRIIRIVASDSQRARLRTWRRWRKPDYQVKTGIVTYCCREWIVNQCEIWTIHRCSRDVKITRSDVAHRDCLLSGRFGAHITKCSRPCCSDFSWRRRAAGCGHLERRLEWIVAVNLEGCRLIPRLSRRKRHCEIKLLPRLNRDRRGWPGKLEVVAAADAD